MFIGALNRPNAKTFALPSPKIISEAKPLKKKSFGRYVIEIESRFCVYLVTDYFFLIILAGWVMQMCRFVYISRKWENDETRIGKLVSYLGKNSVSQPYQLVLFPEGTNLTPKTLQKSREYSQANNLKPLNYVLQPRTTGFTYIVQQMRES